MGCAGSRDPAELAAQRDSRRDHEWRARFGLREQANIRDAPFHRHRRGEKPFRFRSPGPMLVRRQPPRQRHVKEPRLQHVRIAEPHQHRVLRRGQARATPASQLSVGRRGAIAIQPLHARIGQGLQRRAGFGFAQRQKPVQIGHRERRQLKGRDPRGDFLGRRHQAVPGAAGCQTHRWLQGRVKPVAARFRRDLRDAGDVGLRERRARRGIAPNHVAPAVNSGSSLLGQ